MCVEKNDSFICLIWLSKKYFCMARGNQILLSFWGSASSPLHLFVDIGYLDSPKIKMKYLLRVTLAIIAQAEYQTPVSNLVNEESDRC